VSKNDQLSAQSPLNLGLTKLNSCGSMSRASCATETPVGASVTGRSTFRSLIHRSASFAVRSPLNQV
jgi:hypothetical protein